MNCPHCQAEIPDDSKFCLECGNELADAPAAAPTAGAGIDSGLTEAERLYVSKKLASCRQTVDGLKAAIMKLAAAGTMDSMSPEVKRLDALEARLLRQEERLLESRQAVEDALAEHDYPRCCELAERATRITTETTGCESAWQQAERFQEELRTKLAEARRAEKVQDWPHLQACCRRILQLRPGHTEGKHLLQQADAALGKRQKLVIGLAAGIVGILLLGLIGIVVLINMGNTRDRQTAYGAAVKEGEVHLRGERWQQAEESFKAAQMIPGHTNDPEAAKGIRRAKAGALLAAAEEARLKRDWQTVAENGEKACRLLPDSLDARTYRDLGRGQLRLAQARQHIAAGEYDKALQLTDQTPSGTPETDVAAVREAAAKGLQFNELVALVEALLEQQQWRAAQAKAVEAESLGVDAKRSEALVKRATAGLHVARAEDAIKQQQWATAMEHVNAALAGDPTFGPAVELRQTVAPRVVDVTVARARDKMRERRYREALQALEEVIKLAPDHNGAKKAAAACRRQLADYGSELAAGRKARTNRRYDQAARHFRQAIRIFPAGAGDEELKTLRTEYGAVNAELAKAEAAIRQHDFAAAGDIVDRILAEQAPGNAAARRLKAIVKEVLAKSEQLYREAAAAHEKGDPALALMHLSQLHKINRQHAEGMALYKTIRGDRNTARALRTKAADALKAGKAATGKKRRELYEQAFENALQALQLLTKDGETEAILRQVMPEVAPPELVAVTLPEFIMGADAALQRTGTKGIPDLDIWPADEVPAHRVKLRPFFIGKTEVTNAEFCDFLNAKTDENRRTVRKFKVGELQQFNIRIRDGRFLTSKLAADKPVTMIPWADARAYCRWYGQQMGLVGDLPTEAQWEMAAACAPTKKQKRLFPWGDDLKQAAELARDSIARSQVRTTPIDKSGFGAFDLAGNVAEWCRDYYSAAYYKDCRRQVVVRDPVGPQTGGLRVIRGGAAGRNGIPLGHLRTTRRARAAPAEGRTDLGFRVVLELPREE